MPSASDVLNLFTVRFSAMVTVTPDVFIVPAVLSGLLYTEAHPSIAAVAAVAASEDMVAAAEAAVAAVAATKPNITHTKSPLSNRQGALLILLSKLLWNHSRGNILYHPVYPYNEDIVSGIFFSLRK